MKKLCFAVLLFVSFLLSQDRDLLLEDQLKPESSSWKGGVKDGSYVEINLANGERVDGSISSSDPEGYSLIKGSTIQRVKFSQMTPEDRFKYGYNREALIQFKKMQKDSRDKIEKELAREWKQKSSEKAKLRAVLTEVLLSYREEKIKNASRVFSDENFRYLSALKSQYLFNDLSPETTCFIDNLPPSYDEARRIRDEIVENHSEAKDYRPYLAESDVYQRYVEEMRLDKIWKEAKANGLHQKTEVKVINQIRN